MLELLAKTEQNIVEEFKSEIENAKVNDIFKNLQLDYLFIYDADSNSSETIKSLDIANNSTVSAIFKYGEIVRVLKNVERCFVHYQQAYNKNKSVKRFKRDRQELGFRISHTIRHIREFAQVYNTIIKFVLKNFKKLNEEIVADPNISWESLYIARRMKLIEIFNNRLVPCNNLFIECDDLQQIALSALTEMTVIFNDLRSDNEFRHFVKKWKKFLKDQESVLSTEKFKQKLKFLSNKILKIERNVSFQRDLDRWKNEVYAGDLEKDPFTNVSVSDHLSSNSIQS